MNSLLTVLHCVSICLYTSTLALYQDLLTTGGSKVKLSTCSDVPGHRADVQKSGAFPSKWVCAHSQVSECVTDCNDWPWSNCEGLISGSLGDAFSGSESCPKGVQKECASPQYAHPTSRYIIVCVKSTRPYPHVNTAGNKYWGEKAWVWG